MQSIPVVLASRINKLFANALSFRTLLAVVLFLAASSRPVSAQSGQQFVGHVEDTSHASIVGAVVTIHNEDTGEDIVARTTGAGDYTVPYLKAGTYTITAVKDGFKEVSRTHISLRVDQASKMDFTLPVGSVSETVTVSSEGTQIELSKADRGEIIDAERVQEMPTDGRNVLMLFGLSPGTINNEAPQYTRMQDNVGSNLHANGISQAVAENMDGATNDTGNGWTAYVPPIDSVAEFKVVLNPYDASYGRAGGAAVDVSLKSGSNRLHGDIYEYARRPWLDANAWQNDYTGKALPAHKRDLFGLEADGPVRIPWLYNGHDKTFFTIQWEQAYETLPNNGASFFSIPNPAWTMGDFRGATYYDSTLGQTLPLTIYDPLSPLVSVVDPHDGKTKQAHSPFPNNVIPATCTPLPPATACSHLDPIGLALAQYYNQIKPNYDPGPGNSAYHNNYYYLANEDDISRIGLVKLDHNFGPNDRGSIRWGGEERYALRNPNGIPDSNPTNETFRQVQPKSETFTLDEIHTFSPSLILDNKASVLTQQQSFYGGTSATRGPFLSTLGFSQHFISNAYQTNEFPYITSSGYLDLGNGGPGGFTAVHTLAYQPSVTVVRGRHTIRAGFDMRLQQLANPGGGNNNKLTFGGFTGQFYNAGEAPGYQSGNSIAALVLGYPDGGSLKFSAYPFYSQHYYGVWAQDDWKITPKLTLNFGLRYDLLAARTERHNKMNYAFNTSAANPIDAQVTNRAALVNPLTGQASGPIMGGIEFAGVNGNPRGAYATNLLNLQPRFGAAYAFSSRTSLRAGFGEMYINNESNDSSNGFSADTAYTNSLNNGITPYGNLSDPFPATVKPTGSSLGYMTTPGSSVNFANPHFRIPSLWEYSVSMEQLLTKRDVLDISYSGTRAYDLEGSIDLNHISPAWDARCDIERGGNRHICDDSSTGQVANPFYQVPAFAGSGSYYTSPKFSGANLTRPFPAFTSVSQDHSNLIHTWYNSLQVSASHNVSKSLTFHFAYTWSKIMTAGNIIDQVNGLIERKVAGNDVPTAITLSGVFYVPVGRGKTLLAHTNRIVDAVVGGWEISPLYVYTQGTPWSPGTNWEQISPIGIKRQELQPDGQHVYKRLQAVTPCVGAKDTDTGNVILGPTAVAAGCTSAALVRTPNGHALQHNVVYWGVRTPANHQFDASISKNFAWNEKVRLQTRLDMFNLLNHPNWSYGYNNDPNSKDWGSIQKGPQGPSNPPRDLQISGKITF